MSVSAPWSRRDPGRAAYQPRRVRLADVDDDVLRSGDGRAWRRSVWAAAVPSVRVPGELSSKNGGARAGGDGGTYSATKAVCDAARVPPATARRPVCEASRPSSRATTRTSWSGFAPACLPAGSSCASGSLSRRTWRARRSCAGLGDCTGEVCWVAVGKGNRIREL